MKTPAPLLPDLPTLRARLTSALNGNVPPGKSVTVLSRRPPRLMSTFPNEVVTCRLPNGRHRRVFIKYESHHGHDAFGHRGNLAYEAQVYRHVLQSYPDFRPRCLGVHTDRATGETWLLLEYLDHAMRVSDLQVRRKIRQPRAQVQAARWLGRFHAVHEPMAGSNSLGFLIRYDADYYRGWPRRTAEFTASLRGRFPWLTELCLRTEEWAGLLLAGPPTVIHGECYAKNILLRRSRIHVVDWESTALAAGEIDLAALTEGGWPTGLVRRCERAYQRARWPNGAPADFELRLSAAKTYLHFRWLGERPDWALREKSMWRFDQLRAVAARLGLL